MKKLKIGSVILTLIAAAVYYYVMIPPINPSSIEFYAWLVIILAMLAFFCYLFATIHKAKKEDAAAKSMLHAAVALTAVILAIIILIPVSGFLLGPIFHAEEYHQRINVINSEFAEDVKEADFNHLPLLDKDSSEKLGDRVLGQLPELISQFEVSDQYTQINYGESIVRVTPLEYNGLIKYLNNRSEGTPGYIIVNSTTGSAQLVKLSEGMRYMPSSYLNEDLLRHVRFHYPFAIFGKTAFEVDEEGNPFWIIQTLSYKGVGLKKEVSGIIAVDPVSGKMVRYQTDEIPSWIDNVWDADLIIEQLNSWGKYGSGFLNAYMSQKGVSQTTEGYNYLTQDDDVFMYTGITSAAADESNIGFVLVNLRTKQASYYAVPGAEEYSAMDSARGQVQEKNYTSTFPLLINLNDKPTYMLSLKDAAGLVKMYAFVDVEDYQKVTVSDSSMGIEAAAKEYLKENQSGTTQEILDQQKTSITIQAVSYVVIDSNSYAYLLSEKNEIYRIAIKANSQAAFLNAGDRLDVQFVQQGDIFEITSFEKLAAASPDPMVPEETGNMTSEESEEANAD